jgi:hypothetical protein
MLGLGKGLGKQDSSSLPGTGGSPAPSLLKHFTFDSDTESWGVFNGTIAWLFSHTPSSDTQKTGILSVTDGSGSITCSISFDFAGFTGYDNTQPMYYEIVFSVPTLGDFTGIQKVLYGAGGSEVTHSSATQNEWTTINGALASSGTSDEIVIFFTPTSGVAGGSKLYIDSIKFSHTDFR